jgi:hypothetical protein
MCGPLAIVGASAHIGHEQRGLYIINWYQQKQVAWKTNKNSFLNLLFHGKHTYLQI